MFETSIFNDMSDNEKYLAFSSNEIYRDLVSVFQNIFLIYNFDAGAIYLPNTSSSDFYELIYSVGFPQRYCEQTKTIVYGHGFSGTAAALNAIRISEDTSDDPRFSRTALQEAGFKSFISIPLIADESVMGIFNFAFRTKVNFTSDKIEILFLMGYRLGLYVRDHLLLNDIIDREKLTKRLYILGTEIFRIQNLSRICLITLEESRVLLNVDCAFIVFKQTNEIYSKGLANQALSPDLINQLFANLKQQNYVVKRSSLPPSSLLNFFNSNNLENLYLINLGVGETPLGILVFGQGANKYKKFDVLACNQIGRNLSVAISRYFYNKNTQEHAVLKEQNRISRELHDSLAQQLSAVANKLEFIERQIVSEESLNLILPEIKQLKDLVELTNNDVRESISGLRLLKPDDNYSFAEVIEKYLTVFKKTCPDIEIDIDIAQHNLIIPFNIQIQLFRIIQEGLTNIRKHSKATKVSVSLKFYNNSLVIEIADDGIGFSLDKLNATGCGLAVMQERAEEIGAKYEILSAEGEGTTIIISLYQYLLERRE